MPLVRFGRLKKSNSKKKIDDGDASSASVAGNSEGVYIVTNVKRLPKLHRAVWKRDLNKTKKRTKNIKEKELNRQDEEGLRTAIHLACSKGFYEIIHHLCSCKASVTLCDRDGCTPLHRALEGGNSQCLSLLLEQGADVQSADSAKRTPLHLTAVHGDVGAATILLEKNAWIDACDKSGNTPLLISITYGHVDYVSLLLRHGANVNATNYRNITPLILAVLESQLAIVKVLIQHKANPKVEDHQGFTALDHASTQNMHECVELIKEHIKAYKQEEILKFENRQQSVDKLKPISEPYRGIAADKSFEDITCTSDASEVENSVNDIETWKSISDDEECADNQMKDNIKALMLKHGASFSSKSNVPESYSAQQESSLAKFNAKQEEPVETKDKEVEGKDSSVQAESLDYKNEEATNKPAKEAADLKSLLEEEEEEHSAGHGFDSDDDSLSFDLDSLLPDNSPARSAAVAERRNTDEVLQASSLVTSKQKEPVETSLKGKLSERNDSPQQSFGFLSPTSEKEKVIEAVEEEREEKEEHSAGHGFDSSDDASVDENSVNDGDSWKSNSDDEELAAAQMKDNIKALMLKHGVSFSSKSESYSAQQESSLVKFNAKQEEPVETRDKVKINNKNGSSLKEESLDYKNEEATNKPAKEAAELKSLLEEEAEEHSGFDSDDDSLSLDLDSLLPDNSPARSAAVAERRNTDEVLQASSLVTSKQPLERNNSSQQSFGFLSPTYEEEEVIETVEEEREEEEEHSDGHGFDSSDDAPVDENSVNDGDSWKSSCNSDDEELAAAQMKDNIKALMLKHGASFSSKSNVPESYSAQQESSLVKFIAKQEEPVETKDKEVEGKDSSVQAESLDYKNEEATNKPAKEAADLKSLLEEEEEEHSAGHGFDSDDDSLSLDLDSLLPDNSPAKSAAVTERRNTDEVLQASSLVTSKQPLERNNSPRQSFGFLSPTYEEEEVIETVEEEREEEEEHSDRHGFDSSNDAPVDENSMNDGDSWKSNSDDEEFSAVQMKKALMLKHGVSFSSKSNVPESNSAQQESSLAKFNAKQEEPVETKDKIKINNKNGSSLKEESLDIKNEEATNKPAKEAADLKSLLEEEEEEHSGFDSDDSLLPDNSPARSAAVAERRNTDEVLQASSLVTSKQEEGVETPVKGKLSESRNDYSKGKKEKGNKEEVFEKEKEKEKEEVIEAVEEEREEEEEHSDRHGFDSSDDAPVDENDGNSYSENEEFAATQIKKTLSSAQESSLASAKQEKPVETKDKQNLIERNGSSLKEESSGFLFPMNEEATNKPAKEAADLKSLLEEEEEELSGFDSDDSLLPDNSPARSSGNQKSSVCESPKEQHSDQVVIDCSNEEKKVHIEDKGSLAQNSDVYPVAKGKAFIHQPKHLVDDTSGALQPLSTDKQPLMLDLQESEATSIDPSQVDGKGGEGSYSDVDSSSLIADSEDREEDDSSRVLSPSEEDLLSSSIADESGFPLTSTLLSHHTPFSRKMIASPVPKHTSVGERQDSEEQMDVTPTSSFHSQSEPAESCGSKKLLSSPAVSHILHLQNSLSEAKQGMKNALIDHVTSERSKKHVEAMLDDSRKKCQEIVNAKLLAEKSKLETELENRELKYLLEQEKESCHSYELVLTQLREQILKTEEQLSREIESKQEVELKKREAEIELRSVKSSNEKLQENVNELTTQLQHEKDSNVLHEKLYNEQLRMCRNLQEESHLVQHKNSQVLACLQNSDANRMNMAERLFEVQRTNSELQLELSEQKHSSETYTEQLEAEVKQLKEELHKKKEKEEVTEFEYLESQQHVEELTSKVKELCTKEVEMHQQLKSATKELQAERNANEQKEDKLLTSKQELEATQALLMKERGQLEAAKQQIEELRAHQAKQEAATQAAEERIDSLMSLMREDGEKSKHREKKLNEEVEEMKNLLSEKDKQYTKLSSECDTLHKDVKALQSEVVTANKALNKAGDELKQANKESHSLLHKHREESSVVLQRLDASESEVKLLRENEAEFKKQVHGLSESCKNLEATCSTQKEELQVLRNELDRKSKLAVRTEAELNAKIVELEKSIEYEKRKTKKYSSLRKSAQAQCDALQEETSQLQRDRAELKDKLKANKRKLKDIETVLNSSTAKLNEEVLSLGRQFQTTHQKLLEESEQRMKVEQELHWSKQEIQCLEEKVAHSISELKTKQEDVFKLEKSNKRLKDLILALEDCTNCKSNVHAYMEQYRLAASNEAKRQFSQKLEEINDQLHQQSIAQMELEKLREERYSRKKEEYEYSAHELRNQLSVATVGMELKDEEAQQYKELYRMEVKKVEQYGCVLQKEKENSQRSKATLKPQHLLGSMQKSFSHPGPPVMSPDTHQMQQPQHSSQRLVNSVRSDLDRSIAKHLEFLPASDPVPALPSRSDHSRSSRSRQEHLEAIYKSHYFV